MNDTRDFDRAVARWLDDGSDATPPEVIDAVLLAIRSTPQELDVRNLRGTSPMTIYLRVAAVLATVAVAGVSAFYAFGLGPNVPGGDPQGPFEGTWVSTSDADGGRQTMTVRATQDGAVEIVVRDDVATVCAGTPSTMTGTGRIEAGTRLVIPAPVYTCDDGSEPETLSGSPLQEQLRDWTLFFDPQTDALSDGFGGLWLREGAGAPSPDPAISGGMWPQTDLAEVRAAQERADAGDPDYTWQVRALVEPEEWGEHIELELVDRFLREVLGWEAYLFNGYASGGAPSTDAEGRPDGTLPDHRFVRCAPGRTNPLYPPQPDSEQPGELCAPTIDDFNYESVSLDLAQLDRQGRDGIWVVNRWRMMSPFAQVDPAVVEAQARERLEEFLAARVAGTGAEGYVYADGYDDVPLLYATTSGAPYERYEIERVDGPRWPYSFLIFSARLFADGDATVVEQEIRWLPSEGLWLDANSTTENGQPVVLSYTSSDGEVAVSAPGPWTMWWPEESHQLDVGVWFGLMERETEPEHVSGKTIGFVDPVAYDAWCAANGGSPLLSAPADATAIAQQLIADPNFETTEPVAARIGGLEAISMDVALAPGGRTCGVGMIVISRWIHSLDPENLSLEPGLRLRLYLVDLPQGMSVQTLAITVVAPADSFEQFIAETAPIIESIEFHPG